LRGFLRDIIPPTPIIPPFIEMVKVV
jgi:hypothetical protein